MIAHKTARAQLSRSFRCPSPSSSASAHFSTVATTVSLRALPSGHDYGVTQTHAPLSRFSDSKMFNLSDSLGRPLFANIQISLVCAACLKTDEPEKCTHKLAEMPRWLSSNKMVRTFFSCHMHAILSLNARPRSVYRKSSRASSQVRILALVLVHRLRACMCTKLTCLPPLRR